MGAPSDDLPGEGFVPNARRRVFRIDEHADAVRLRDEEGRDAGHGDGRTTSTEGSTPGVCGRETGRLRGRTGVSSFSTKVSEDMSDSMSVLLDETDDSEEEEEDKDGERRRT